MAHDLQTLGRRRGFEDRGQVADAVVVDDVRVIRRSSPYSRNIHSSRDSRRAAVITTSTRHVTVVVSQEVLHMSRPSIRDFFANFDTYDASLTEKVRLALRNTASKARRRSDCCGNHGQPGC